MSKRLERLAAWIERNPYKVYADYRDTISDEQAQMLLAGEFQEFDESMWEWEVNCDDYAEWHEWESEFAQQAGYDEWESMPEWLQDFASESRFVDCSDMIRGAIRNYSGNVIAWLQKRNGDYIEFPFPYNDASENKRLRRYLKEACGIAGDSEAYYEGTRLTALGTVDLWEVYRKQKRPTHIVMCSNTKTIGHEPWQGSGTMANDAYAGKSGRVFPAKFFIDGKNPGYGVDSIFGLSGHMWRDELDVICK